MWISLAFSVGTYGLILLWSLDRRFNYRLLDSAFVLGAALEAAHPSLLAPVSRLMKEATHSRLVHFFYLGPSFLFTAAGLYAAVQSGWDSLAICGLLVAVPWWVSSTKTAAFGEETIDGVITEWNSLNNRLAPAKSVAADGSD